MLINLIGVFALFFALQVAVAMLLSEVRGQSKNLAFLLICSLAAVAVYQLGAIQ